MESLINIITRHPKYGTKKKERKRKRILPIQKYERLRWGQTKLTPYAQAVLQVWKSIENVYAIGEKHKCYGYLVAELMGKSPQPYYGCSHLIHNHSICFTCEERIERNLYHYGECKISNCTSGKRHRGIFYLDKCKKCFVPTRGNINMKGYFTILSCIKRMGYDFPLDLRKYVLYRMCGSPR
jgi:hypothetical protein